MQEVKESDSMSQWAGAEPRAANWWLVQPRDAGITCEMVDESGGSKQKAWQVPGAMGYSGCHRCGSMDHRAAECALTVEDWATAQMMKHGREWTQVQVQQILAKAEVRATAATTERQSWSRVVQAGAGGSQWRRKKTPAQVEAQQRYAEQRRVRQAQVAAGAARRKAALAMAAMRRGEYPKPKAMVADAKADVKEAEAKRRAAARRKQQAREVMHDASVERDVAGMAQHRYLDAQAEERNAAAGLQVAQEKKQAAQAEVARQRRTERQLELERQREQVYLEQQWQNLFQVPTDEIEKQKSKCNTKRKAKVKGMIPLDGDV